MAKVIINADDFGLSFGVNEAVIKMHKEGNLTSASMMVTGLKVQDAILKATENPALKVGLHFNLTTGKAVLHPISLPLLVDEKGNFKNGFIKLLLLSVLWRKNFLNQVEAEMKAQIALLKTFGIKPSHIDGHRHIHYLFGVFKIAQKVAKTEGIKRIRVVNESFFNTLTLGFPPISGIIKWLILRFLGLFNGSRNVRSPYFFSIIHSCQISNKLLKNFKPPEGFSEIEIMIHPSIQRFDEGQNVEYEKSHLNSRFRAVELKFIKPKI
jgi:predicted glycoside hydrolase/deacetylase ChbG (UPF0249 family)